MARLLARIIAAQDGWARPLGDLNHRWLSAAFRPIRPIKDLLNGTWLGHPLHPAVTDVPVGALLVAVVLDLAAQPDAAFWALLVGQLTFLASVLTGLADYTDADGTARTRATVHGTVMVIGGGFTAASLILRQAGTGDGALQTTLLIVGFLVITAGAYIGGDIVFALGNMVSRHAFRGAGTKWVRLDTGDLTDLATLPHATPTKARAGINDLLLVRIGTTIHALHAVCSHAGGPLPQGEIVDGCIECPWHGSRFRLDNGQVTQGPALYDQPTYEIRAAEGGGYEVRRTAT